MKKLLFLINFYFLFFFNFIMLSNTAILYFYEFDLNVFLLFKIHKFGLIICYKIELTKSLDVNLCYISKGHSKSY